jgi:hypothetical protein
MWESEPDAHDTAHRHPFRFKIARRVHLASLAMVSGRLEQRVVLARENRVEVRAPGSQIASQRTRLSQTAADNRKRGAGVVGLTQTPCLRLVMRRSGVRIPEAAPHITRRQRPLARPAKRRSVTTA